MSKSGGQFHTTHWSLIAALPKQGDDDQASRAKAALEHLCEAYWRPLYAFARFRGYGPEDARDLTQAFLTRVIETKGLSAADPDRGRFRSYLLGAMKHFMANEREHARAKKRGGGLKFLDGDIAELRSRIGVAKRGSDDEADRVFDRSWAMETTAAALQRLELEWAERGRRRQFDALRPALSGEGPKRPEVALRLGMTENAVSVAVHRLRQRYAALIREAVAQTVADQADVEAEMRYLIGILREK